MCVKRLQTHLEFSPFCVVHQVDGGKKKKSYDAVPWCVQVQTDISVDSKHQTLQGVAFPLHRDAVEALKRYKDNLINYVQLVSPYRTLLSVKRACARYHAGPAVVG